jgi:tyrosinase
MSFAPKTRKSVPIPGVVAVDTRQVNVAVEGLDRSMIPGSFKVHLLKDGRRIASRFMFQASGSAEHVEALSGNRFAHFDFLLPIDAVADGTLSVEVEPLETSAPGELVSPESIGRPTMSVYLMLQTP